MPRPTSVASTALFGVGLVLLSTTVIVAVRTWHWDWLTSARTFVGAHPVPIFGGVTVALFMLGFAVRRRVRSGRGVRVAARGGDGRISTTSWSHGSCNSSRSRLRR